MLDVPPASAGMCVAPSSNDLTVSFVIDTESVVSKPRTNKHE